MPCRHNNGHVTTVQKLHLCTLPLHTATLALQLEPGIVVVVWANFVIAADPEIQHAYTPNDLLVLEIIDEEYSSHRPHTVPNRIVSTSRKTPPPDDIATQTPPRSTLGPQSQGNLPTKSTWSRQMQWQRWNNLPKGL